MAKSLKAPTNSPQITHLQRGYDKLYSGTNACFWQDLASPWYTFVRDHLSMIQNRRVLEIASGRGVFSCYMSQLGADVCAVDIAAQALRIGKEKAHELHTSTQFVCASIYDLPFQDAFFDIVVSCETLEHLEFPRAGLEELVRVMMPGGELYLTTENYLNLVGLYRLTLWFRGRKFNSGAGIQPIEQPFTYFYLLRLLKHSGVRVVLTGASIHQIWIPRHGFHNLRFVENSPVLRRLSKCFARHVYFVARKDK